jgi:hypothetical protein
VFVQAQTLAAVAACCAAGISLFNVGYQAYLASRNETRKWQREKLPELVRQFSASNHELNVIVFFKADEWKREGKAREREAATHFKKSMSLFQPR